MTLLGAASIGVVVGYLLGLLEIRYYRRRYREAERRENALRQLVYWFALQEGQSAWEHQHAGPILRYLYPESDPRDFFGKPLDS